MPVLNAKLSDNDELTAAMLLACQAKLKEENKEKFYLDFLKACEEDGEALKTAYRKLMLLIHPDRRGGSKEFQNFFKAATTLKDYAGNEKTKAKVREIIEVVKNPIYQKKLAQIASAKNQEANVEQEQEEQAHAQRQRDLDAARARGREEKKGEDDYKKREKAARESGAAVRLTSFLQKGLQSEYLDSLKTKKNWAQKIHTYKEKRVGQTDSIDDIKQQLLQDKRLSDVVKAEILYAVLRMLEKDLKNEFRWTRWLGTKGRLDGIVQKDMEALRKDFPGVEAKSDQRLHEFAKEHPNLKIRENFADLREENKKHHKHG